MTRVPPPPSRGGEAARPDGIPRALDLTVFRTMADMSNDAFYLTDVEGRFRYVNERAVTLTGYSREELLGMTLFDLDPLYPRDQFQAIVAALGHDPVPPFEARTRRKDGSWHRTEVSVVRLDVEGETFLFGAVRDIGERKQMETVQRSFAQRMLQTVEAERQRVARELHDDVGQAAATLGVLLHALERTPGAVTDDVRPALAGIHASLRRVTEAIARIVRDYHPADLLALGFEEAVRGYARQFAARHNLVLRLTTTPVEGLLDAERELHLYRIVQAALTNVAQHAAARQIVVRIGRQGPRVIVVLRDDGRGFDPAAPPAGGLGLVTMRERIELSEGTLEVRSAPGRGTELRISVPIREDASAAAPSRRRAPAP